MVLLKRLIVFVATIAMLIQPTLEDTSARQIYNRVMLASFRHTGDSKPSFVMQRPKWLNKESSRSSNKQSSNANQMKMHKHKNGGNGLISSWKSQIHSGVDVAKEKVSKGMDYWNAMGNARWNPHIPYPYHDYYIAKGLAISTRESRKVLKDYWWDLGNDKWRYGIKQFIGTVCGVVGYFTRTSAFGTSPIGLITGPLFGYLFASAEHYVERRFYYEDYKNRTLERRKDMHVKLMHPGVDIHATKKPPRSSDESYENE